MKVNFTYTNGRERVMLERDAKILAKLGRGTYLTRDMHAALIAAEAPPATEVHEDAPKRRGRKSKSED